MSETWVPSEGGLVIAVAEWCPGGHGKEMAENIRAGVIAKVRAIHTAQCNGHRVLVLQYSPDDAPETEREYEYFDTHRQCSLYLKPYEPHINRRSRRKKVR